jgi:carbamoyl-phosphate synthase small subunit
MDSVLVLEDGSVFKGKAFGYPCEDTGEVVFNTGMVGYPEALTDPSYYGQILMQTYPLIGNYGVPSFNVKDDSGIPLFFESAKIQVKGYVVSSLSCSPSHWSSVMSLDEWLKNQRVPGIILDDTRELTKKLRVKGTMLGIIGNSTDLDMDKLVTRAKEVEDPNKRNLAREVSVNQVIEHPSNPRTNKNMRIIVIDCGVKNGILRNLNMRGLKLLQVPCDLNSDEILSYLPSGILISNGPGDPKKCEKTIETIKQLMETEIPILGICLGLQLMSLAAGANTFKLKFGHRGQNHPCLDLRTKRCFITSQNHGFATEKKSIEGSGFECTMVNANDGTLEAIEHRTKKIFAVQFHPEASPGPYDTGFIFDKFISAMNEV